MARRGYNKFSAKKTVADGITFDSKAEAERYQVLKLLERTGNIRDLELQPEFELQPKFKRDGKTVRAIKYRADFRYYDCDRGEIVVEDVKGMETKEFKLKKKMLLYQYPDICFELVK